MPTNHYFNNYENSAEQNLIEDLVIESIKIYGHDVYYIPRTLKNRDDIYGEDSISTYNKPYFIDMYVRSFDAYGGDGQFLSKFGLEIRDQTVFSIALRTFDEEVGIPHGLARPREGDLIWFPMVGRLLQIQYVDKTPVFYQMGKLQFYDLTCEVFEYSNERLETGIPEIDDIENTGSFDMSQYALLTEEGLVLTDEDGFDMIQEQFNEDTQADDFFSDSIEFQTESDNIIDWSEIDPFSEGGV